jgi:hypothetical protein
MLALRAIEPTVVLNKDYKSELFCLLAKGRGLPTDMIKSMVSFKTNSVDQSMFQCQFSLRGFKEGEMFVGMKCPKRSIAEQSAAQVFLSFLDDSSTRKEFNLWKPQEHITRNEISMSGNSRCFVVII